MFEYNYEFSIVMGYYNRKEQILHTLNDFNKYELYNFQVIIIDDNSSKEHTLDDITFNNYKYPIIYKKITATEKGNRINPCVVYNKGFSLAEGKYVFIQNPECLHIGDLFNYVRVNPFDREYIAFSCYNITTKELTEQLYLNNNIVNSKKFRQINSHFGPEWYNHPKYRNSSFHFCSVIKNDYLKILGGFNEKFKNGYWYDDDELLLSIKHNLCLNIKTIEPDNGYVVHQYHERDSESKFTNDEINNMRNLNKKEYNNMLSYHNENNFNFPKILHLYWDKSPLSFLNFCTILSFNKYHKYWKINIYIPKNKNNNIDWNTSEQKEKYTGKDYFSYLYNIENVNIHTIDFKSINSELIKTSEVVRSDYFRYYILNKYGGVWSDFDIIYMKNIELSYGNISGLKKTIIYHYKCPKTEMDIIPVGLFITKPNVSFFKCLLKYYKFFYNKTNYQSLGTQMVSAIIFQDNFIDIAKEINGHEIIIEKAKKYLPLDYLNIEKFYNKEIMNDNYDNDIYGFHWFNGSKISKDYCNNLNKRYNENNNLDSCLMDKLIKEYVEYI